MSITADASGGVRAALDAGETADGTTLDIATFAALYAEHRKPLYRFCGRRIHDRTLVEDIVQDVFERAFACRSRFDPTREFWPWLASIAARVCIDTHRRSVNAVARDDQYAKAAYSEARDLTSATVLRAFEQRHLGRQLEALPVRQRATLGLFALDGWTYDQIASHLGYSIPVVKALIHRARTNLREGAERWAAGGLGLARVMRSRARHGLARLQAAVWPSFEPVGWSGADLLSGVSVALTALAIASGALAPVASHPTQALAPMASLPTAPGAAGPSASASVGVALGRADAGEPGAKRAPDVAYSPGRRAGGAEGMGNEAVASALPGTAGNDDPESIHAVSFAESSNPEDDSTVFVAGRLTGDVDGLSMPLLVSRDHGESWTRARAAGLAPVVRLLLPPAYPRDNRLFALTAKGLQASADDGDTFETLVAVPQIVDAAFSPAFDRGDPTVLFVAGERLWQYADDTGSVSPVAVAGGPARHAVMSVGFDPGPTDGRGVVVGSRNRTDVALGDSGLHISRCSKGSVTTTADLPQLHCDSVKLPKVPTDDLPLRLSPTFRSGLFYVPFSHSPYVSADGGRTFRPARRHGAEEDQRYRIYDLAAVPSPSGESAIVAQQSSGSLNGVFAWGPQLARTDDGGRTWTSITVDLPHFDWAAAVTVSPAGRIIAGSGTGGLACSLDGGRSWARTCPGRPRQ